MPTRSVRRSASSPISLLELSRKNRQQFPLGWSQSSVFHETPTGFDSTMPTTPAYSFQPAWTLRTPRPWRGSLAIRISRGKRSSTISSKIDPHLGMIVTMRTVARLENVLLTIAFWIAVVLGSLALLLTVSGLFSVLSYLVAQRTREIGVRMALGASSRAVIRLMLAADGATGALRIGRRHGARRHARDRVAVDAIRRLHLASRARHRSGRLPHQRADHHRGMCRGGGSPCRSRRTARSDARAATGIDTPLQRGGLILANDSK